MALRPTDIASNNYGIALKPLLGREKKLKISTTPALELSALQVTAANTLSVTDSVAGMAALEDSPRQVLLKAEEEFRATAAVVIGVLGTDEADAILSGTVRFSPPAYVQEQGFIFPAGTAREAVIAAGKKFKTITTFVPTAIDATAVGAKFSVFGLPDPEDFVLVGCRVTLDYTPEVRTPVSVPCGGDDSAYVKPGQKPERTVSITVKQPSLSDGLARYNGIPDLVLLLVSDKQDKLVTDHEFLIGAIVTGRHSNPESSEPSTLTGEGIYEDYAHIPAGPLAGA